MKRTTTPTYNPTETGDALDQLVEILAGLRNRLIHNGFSEDAAEDICVQQHAGFVESYLNE